MGKRRNELRAEADILAVLGHAGHPIPVGLLAAGIDGRGGAVNRGRILRALRALTRAGHVRRIDRALYALSAYAGRQPIRSLTALELKVFIQDNTPSMAEIEAVLGDVRSELRELFVSRIVGRRRRDGRFVVRGVPASSGARVREARRVQRLPRPGSVRREVYDHVASRSPTSMWSVVEAFGERDPQLVRVTLRQLYAAGFLRQPARGVYVVAPRVLVGLSFRDELLAALRVPRSLDELRQAFPRRSRDTLASTLRRLVAQGAVVRIERGVYQASGS